eukprot:2753394-Amphidinium_carterae.1
MQGSLTKGWNVRDLDSGLSGGTDSDTATYDNATFPKFGPLPKRLFMRTPVHTNYALHMRDVVQPISTNTNCKYGGSRGQLHQSLFDPRLL